MPEVAILVKAKDEASATFKTVAGSLDELAGAGKAALVPMAALAAVGTGLIAKTTLTAARTEELGVVVENLGRVSGYSEERLAETEDSIKKLGLTTQATREIMARFMGAQLDLADASKIARAAQDLAVIGMQDSSVAANNLTYAIASMQPRILRQYGIFVNLNDVYAKTAEALGKNIDELTENEKRQGMLNATLEQAGRFTGTYEAAMDTAGKQLRSFRRYTEEASNVFGENFLPYLGEGVNLITDLAKGFIGASEETQKNAARTVAYATAMSGAVAAAAGFLILLPKIKLALLALYGPGGAFLLAVGIMAAFAAKAVEVEMAQKELRKELLESAASAEDYVEKMREGRDELRVSAAGVRGLTGVIGEHVEAQEAAGDAWDFTIEKMEPVMKAQMEEAKLIARMTHETHYWSEETIRAVSEVQAAMLTTTAGAVLDIRESVDAYRDLREEQSGLSEEQAAARAAEAEEIKKAAEERLILLGLEMMEHRDLLRLPMEGYEDMELSAQEYMDLIESGLIPLSAEFVTDFRNEMGAVDGIWDQATQTGETSMDELYGYVDPIFDGIVRRSEELPGEVLENSISVGQSIVDGTILGIQTASPQLDRAAITAARNALHAAKIELGAESPSQKFAELGRDMMRGMAMGIMANQEQPALAAQGAAQETTNIYTGDVYGLDGVEAAIDRSMEEKQRSTL